MTAPPLPPIRWDIVEEHLDEAGFLRQLWEEALRSPDYSLPEIAEGPEERMLAHLDGLVVAGRRAAEKLLLPALGSEEAGPAFAAAFALLQSEDGDFTDAVLGGLEKAEPGEGRAAIARALSVAPRPDLGARLAALAPKAAAPLQADLLWVLGELRHDPGMRLEPLWASAEPGLRSLALRLTRLVPGRLDPAAPERGLADPEEAVREEALRSGMVLGSRGAFAAAEAAVASKGSPAFATAALLLGLSGDEKSLGPLVQALGDEATRGPAAFALGFTGRVSAADALLAAMSVEELGPLAAEGFSAITGLAIGKKFALPPKRWDPEAPEEPDEPYGPEADLPKPEPEAIAAWWKGARPKLDPAQRWLRGQPWGAEAVLRELAEGPARRRKALALDLAIRTKGQVQLAWDALSARQRKELAEARGGAGRMAGKGYREGAR